jgi:hypothetical protein
MNSTVFSNITFLTVILIESVLFGLGGQCSDTQHEIRNPHSKCLIDFNFILFSKTFTRNVLTMFCILVTGRHNFESVLVKWHDLEPHIPVCCKGEINDCCVDKYIRIKYANYFFESVTVFILLNYILPNSVVLYVEQYYCMI